MPFHVSRETIYKFSHIGGITVSAGEKAEKVVEGVNRCS